jgi:lipopolysaccharide biosynthesis glycosyltransferase
MECDIIHIACCLDDNFLFPTGAMLVSLFETNKTNKFHIHLISGNLKNENINLLKNITHKYNMMFDFYLLDKSLFENFNVNYRISIAAYYRILIPEIINLNITKILYLDGDMIINGDISPLWKIELNNYIIGAVNDIVALELDEFIRMKTPKEFGYFNSGMLLIDTKNWRANNTTKKILDYLNENHAIIKFHDQDALNGILYNKRKNLSPEWNFQVGLYYCSPFIIHSAFPEIYLEKIIKHPIIVHFNGIEKPWHYVSLHPFAKKFKYYLRLSGLKNYQEQVDLKKIIKKQTYRLLGWKRITRYFYNKQKAIQYANQINF